MGTNRDIAAVDRRGQKGGISWDEEGTIPSCIFFRDREGTFNGYVDLLYLRSGYCFIYKNLLETKYFLFHLNLSFLYLPWFRRGPSENVSVAIS